MNVAVPRYPVATLLNASRAVAVKLEATAVAAGFVATTTVKLSAVAGLMLKAVLSAVTVVDATAACSL